MQRAPRRLTPSRPSPPASTPSGPAARTGKQPGGRGPRSSQPCSRIASTNSARREQIGTAHALHPVARDRPPGAACCLFSVALHEALEETHQAAAQWRGWSSSRAATRSIIHRQGVVPLEGKEREIDVRHRSEVPPPPCASQTSGLCVREARSLDVAAPSEDLPQMVLQVGFNRSEPRVAAPDWSGSVVQPQGVVTPDAAGLHRRSPAQCAAWPRSLASRCSCSTSRSSPSRVPARSGSRPFPPAHGSPGRRCCPC